MALDYNKRIGAARWQTKRYEHNRKALFANFYPNIKGSVSGLYSTLSRSATLDIASPWAWTMAEKVQSLAPWWISDNMKEQLAQRWTEKLTPLNPEIEMKVKGMFAANVQIEQPASGQMCRPWSHACRSSFQASAPVGEQLCRIF